MGKVVGPPLTQSDKNWILEQHVFFHASAPLSALHRVNVSPKSAKEFKIIDDCTVAWADLAGSGSETCAHVLQNGRLTVLFVAFNGPPKILRLHGKGSIVLRSELQHPHHQELAHQFQDVLSDKNEGNFGIRAIVVMKIERASQSCGYSIPQFVYKAERTTLTDVTVKKGCEGIEEYRRLKNSYSIDGLPSIAQLEAAHTHTSPVELDYADGYVYVTKYGNSLWKQCQVRCSLAWHFFAWDISQRDIYMIALGAGIGAVAMHLKGRIK